MTSPFTDVDIFPTVVDVPDNSDLPNPSAGALNVGTEGALERGYYTHKRLAGALATSWQRPVALPAVVDNVRWATFWGEWWGVGGGNADLITVSNDFGQSWPGGLQINIGLDGLPCWDLDFDAVGDCLVTNDSSTTTYFFTASTATWAHSVAALVGTVHHPLVRYDMVNTVWLVFYNDTAYGLRAASSLDGVTLIDRSASLAAGQPFFATSGTYAPHMGVGDGHFVVAVKSSATQIKIGSVNASALSVWAGATITAAYLTTITDCSHPVFSAEDAAWLIAIYGTAPANATEIWQSVDDGATWTHVKTLNHSGVRMIQLANVGHLWAGITIDGFVVYSLDVGNSWYSAGMFASHTSPTHLQLWSGGGGLLEVDAVDTRSSSIRLGNQGAAQLS